MGEVGKPGLGDRWCLQHVQLHFPTVKEMLVGSCHAIGTINYKLFAVPHYMLFL